MKNFDIQSIQLPVGHNEAFDYIANRHNLPAWANAFATVSATGALLRTPMGEVDITLDVESDKANGVVDWIMKFPDGNVGKACSRVVSVDENNSIYSFTLFAPPVPLEQLEGALNAQSKILAGELVALKGILAQNAIAA